MIFTDPVFALAQAADSTSSPALIRFADVVMMIAVLLAPLIAVHVQRWLDVAAEKRARKYALLRTLWATRGSQMAPQHVTALNMIDIEFGPDVESVFKRQSPADKRVVSAWREYLDSLDFGPAEDPSFNAKVDRSFAKFIDLMYEMSSALGYTFDKVTLKKQVYRPKGHVDWEVREARIREGLQRILDGNDSVRVSLVPPHDATEGQLKASEDWAKVVAGTQPITVRIEDGVGGYRQST